MRILSACALLLVFQLAGEGIARMLGLSLPGPVLGMALLVLALIWRGLSGHNGEALRQTSGALLGNLSLLFVPAAVGITLHLHRLREEWMPIVIALVISTALGLAATAWVIQRLAPRETVHIAEGQDD